MLSKKILPSTVANATLDNEIKGVWAGNGNMVIETGGLTIIVKTPSAIFKTAKIANPNAYLQSLMETDNGGRIQYPSLLDTKHQQL
ncbi:hypothetical protein HAP94_07255, partial [Acidithiobacillus ferrivorans]|nr:hypothetical protein [Acidithiobacillus ferrivorans]